MSPLFYKDFCNGQVKIATSSNKIRKIRYYWPFTQSLTVTYSAAGASSRSFMLSLIRPRLSTSSTLTLTT